ncbi:MAG: methyltransferase domain-containing protein [Hyphomicrobiaceae bacterium]
MTSPFQQAAQIAGNTARFGWYYGINWLLDREAARLGAKPAFKPTQPVPSRQELLTDLASVFLADGNAVRAGLYPAMRGEEGPIADHLARLRLMMADLPGALERRQTADASTARQMPDAEGLPDYFTQDFHFQTGGYLSADSAKLYDVQVETLFYGSANAMRRSGLRPVAEFIRGKDQRRLSLLDVACGTGRFLRQIRLAFPALKLTGVDLSQPYLDEARRHMGDLRPAALVQGNGEALPFSDASQDIVTSIFLFHELPALVRRHVTTEMARVLKPGGILLFIDSLQIGDRPGWDGLLEAFPHRFHEPYYTQYTTDDLDGLFADAGLEAVSSQPVFLSKRMVRRKV